MKLINSNYIYLSSPSTYLYILKMLLSIHYTYFGLYLQNLKWLQMKLLFIGPNGNVNKGSLRLVCSKNASNVCLLQLNWKKFHCMIMIIKDLLLYGTIEKIMIFFSSCIKILHYVHILKNHTLNLKMKSRKLAAYFALRVDSSTSQPAFRHKNTAKLAPFPRQKYEY